MQLRTSTSMQMIDHKVENLVSAINKPKIQWKNKGKVERMRCSRRQEEKHGKSAKRKFRKPVSQCENFANQIRNAKISQCEISQCQNPFRNANFKFAMPIPISQCENFAMRNFAMPKSISQCQFKIRNANSNFAMRKFRNTKFAMRKFRNAKFRNAKVHFALRNSLPLRN